MFRTRLPYFKVRKIRKQCVTTDSVLDVDPDLFQDAILHNLQSHPRESKFIFPPLAQGMRGLWDIQLPVYVALCQLTCLETCFGIKTEKLWLWEKLLVQSIPFSLKLQLNLFLLVSKKHLIHSKPYCYIVFSVFTALLCEGPKCCAEVKQKCH